MTSCDWFLSVPSSVDQHLGCFQLLAILNLVSINTQMCTFVLSTSFSSFGYIPRSGIVGLHIQYLSFLRNCQTFPMWLNHSTFPTTVRVWISPLLNQHIIFHFLRCGPNKQKRLRRGGKNTQKNCTKKLLMTQITTMVWSLT